MDSWRNLEFVRSITRGVARVALGSAVAAFSACSAPELTDDQGPTAIGKKATLESVDLYLSEMKCAEAVTAIEPLYNSTSTDNEVRMKAASAYACHAGINFFAMLGSIAESIDTLSSGLWAFLSRLFPSELGGTDYVVEGAVKSMQSLQSTLVPGAVVLPAYQVNPVTAENPAGYNVGSVFTKDRTDAANLYMIFVSMAAIGGIQNRYGETDVTNYQKTKYLPWNTAVTVDTNGCMYAASILSLVDSLKAAPTSMNSELGEKFALLGDALEMVLDAACDMGCKGGTPFGTGDPTTIALLDPNLPGGLWTDTGCSIPAGCSKCPAELRNMASCTQTVNNPASCAAAGIVNVINVHPLVGWPGGP